MGHNVNEQVRQKLVKSIPANYNSRIHALIPSSVALGIIALAISQITFVWTWWILPLIITTLFLLFGFEWWVHKNIMHTPRKFLTSIYLKHFAHHLIYTDEDMTMRSKQELYYILMPPYAILLVLLFISPIILGLWLIFSSQIAWIVLMVMMVFAISYEWLHYSYHQSESSWIGKRSIIKKLKVNHQKHHNPKLMNHYGFNVTVPIFDWIMRTRPRGEKV